MVPVLLVTGAQLYNPLCLAMVKGFHWLIISRLLMPHFLS